MQTIEGSKISGQESNSSRLHSDYSFGAPAALVSSGGSEATVNTPAGSSSSGTSLEPSPGAPDSVRPTGNADEQLRRLLIEQERSTQPSPRRDDAPPALRDRSREHPRRAQHHRISTPTNSRPTTPRHQTRIAPVTPTTQADQVADLQGQLRELNRRLRVD